MPISELENYLTNNNQKQFSNQTFSDFRQELLQYANYFYKDNIVDFSEVSLGGMLLDFASIVGDSLVYYAEQQFNELNYETATDISNIQKHLRRVNIKNSQASPASVYCTFSIEVERDPASTDYAPEPVLKLLPIIKKGTKVSSSTGVIFTLEEDIDFQSNYKQEAGEEDINGTPLTLFLYKKGLCTSGDIVQETFTLPRSSNKVFLSKDLENTNITTIISIVDEDNNEYYEVDYLTQTTVYKKIKNANDNYLTIQPAPRRFIREDSFMTGKTSLVFGNGKAKVTKDNVFVNPDVLLMPLKSKNNISRVDLDPSLLLKSSTFGVSPEGKTLTVTYKYGGGTSHNLPIGTINSISSTPMIIFPNESNSEEVTDDEINFIINSMSVTNETSSTGGTEPLTLDELKLQIPSAIKAQSRIITHEDLVARILTMPSDFGRVNKVAALDNPVSASHKDLFIICKDADGIYVEANDAIKVNLSNYLNTYRLIGDNYNILDVPVYNFGIKVKVRVKTGYTMTNVIIDINSRLVSSLRFDLFEIGTPINLNNVCKIIEATDGVENIITPRNAIIVSKTQEDEFFDIEDLTVRSYNDNIFNPQTLYKDGFIYPPRGGLFEMRYTFRDIVIAAN